MKFNIVYVDPPWKYDNLRTGGSHKSGASQKYSTLPCKEILELSIPEIATKDAVLFLWVTDSFLVEGIKVLETWGFKYKAKLTWNKERLGMGYWFRGQIENLLFGVKGKVKPFRSQIRNYLQEKPTDHSQKPREFRRIIEEVTANMPNPRKIEIFATERVIGWTTIGFDIDCVDVRVSLKELIEMEETPLRIPRIRNEKTVDEKSKF